MERLYWFCESALATIISTGKSHIFSFQSLSLCSASYVNKFKRKNYSHYTLGHSRLKMLGTYKARGWTRILTPMPSYALATNEILIERKKGIAKFEWVCVVMGLWRLNGKIAYHMSPCKCIWKKHKTSCK